MKGSKGIFYTLRRTIPIFCFLILLAGFVLPGEAEARRYASIVIDAETGDIISASRPDREIYPASLAKMMTLYLLFEALDEGRLTLDQPLKVSRAAARVSPSKLGLKAKQTIKVKDVILALVTKSANDAAVVASEALGGTERKFAKVMTAKARELGMSRTTFKNASGLPNRRQVSTARDLAKLAQALLRDFPQHYHYFSEKSFSYKGRSYRNHNKLLRSYKGADGIKTGYIRASGFNLVASVVRHGRRLIAVVIGGKTSRSRDRHIAGLLDKSFVQVAKNMRKTPTLPERNPFQLAAAQVGTNGSNGASQSVAAPAVRQPAQETVAKAHSGKPGPLAIPLPRPKPAPMGHASITPAAPPAAKPRLTEPQAENGIEVAALTPSDLAAGPELTQGAATPNPAPAAGITAEPIAPIVQPTSQFVMAAQLPQADALDTDTPQVAAERRQVATFTPGDTETDSLEEEIWGVQVGAFSNFGPAHDAVAQAATTIPDLLQATRPVISQINSETGLLYRARLSGLSEVRAREACRLLAERDLSCVVVPPQMTAASGQSAS